MAKNNLLWCQELRHPLHRLPRRLLDGIKKSGYKENKLLELINQWVSNRKNLEESVQFIGSCEFFPAAILLRTILEYGKNNTDLLNKLMFTITAYFDKNNEDGNLIELFIEAIEILTEKEIVAWFHYSEKHYINLQ